MATDYYVIELYLIMIIVKSPICQVTMCVIKKIRKQNLTGGHFFKFWGQIYILILFLLFGFMPLTSVILYLVKFSTYMIKIVQRSPNCFREFLKRRPVPIDKH